MLWRSAELLLETISKKASTIQEMLNWIANMLKQGYNFVGAENSVWRIIYKSLDHLDWILVWKLDI